MNSLPEIANGVTVDFPSQRGKVQAFLLHRMAAGVSSDWEQHSADLQAAAAAEEAGLRLNLPGKEAHQFGQT